MTVSPRVAPPLPASTSTLLAALCALPLFACQDGSNATQTAIQGFRAEEAMHKVQVTAAERARLALPGRVISDYGAFVLVEVDSQTAQSLAGAGSVAFRDDYNDVLLSAGTINTASPFGKSLQGAVKQQATTGKRLHLVQFAGPIRPEWHQSLEASGAKIVTYIPNNAYLVYADASAFDRMQRQLVSSNEVQWNGAYLDDYKVHPSVHSVTTPAYQIQLVSDPDANPVTLGLVRQLQSRAESITEALGYVNVTAYLTRDQALQLASRPDVVSIQPRPPMRHMDERQSMIIAGQVTGNGPTAAGYLAWLASKGFTQAQFTASGFGVDVSDSGLDNGTAAPNHFAFYVGGQVTNSSRVVYNRLEGTPNTGSTISGCDGHGNLNGHIIGGYAALPGANHQDATGYAYGLGVAPFVKLGSSVLFDPGTFTDPDYEDLQSRAYRDGMRISNNSWGSSGNAYSVDSQRYDALVRDAQPADSAVPNSGNQEMVIVFAAGNSGSSANTVGDPGTGKNVLTVGATEGVRAFGNDQCGVTDAQADSFNDMATFSSRGPASDGRKKPDLVAPGTHITGGVAQSAAQRAFPPTNLQGQALSCFDASGVCAGPSSSSFMPTDGQWYTASSGTSHSTPAVSGGAALLRQYFINQGMAPPSPAMTKAYLMNSGRYLTGAGANDNLFSNSQGMGMLDLGMAFDGQPRALDDQTPANLFTATGQTRTFTGTIGSNTAPFRVTLAWTDAPGSTTGSAWKNNLDLTVTTSSGTYKGNVFTGALSVTGGLADSANNVESVFLPAGNSGPYTVTVTAANINSDGVPGNSSLLDQDFALVVYNSCGVTGAVPTGLTATASGNNQVTLSWTSSGASSYSVYRATTPGGPYVAVGSTSNTSFVDNGASGGTTYYYVVRGKECVESANSNEASVTATGACLALPTFAGLTAVTNNAASTCGTTLSWSAATPRCGGTVSYAVYRSKQAGFTPSRSNRIAQGITGTSFFDDLNLASGTAYRYVVRATETSSATNEETNTVEKSATATGAISTGLYYFDDFDANRPANAASYWIPTTVSGTGGTMNLVTNCRYQSASTAYRFGAASTTCGGTYPLSTQAQLVLGGNGTVSGINGFALTPGYAAELSFKLAYDIEARYDGAYLVYSTTGASGPFTAVGDSVSASAPYIKSGGYDNTLSSSSTTRIWTGSSLPANGSLKSVVVDLNALAGQTVWFAFKFSTDNLVNKEGLYLDDVRVTSNNVATCTSNLPPPGPAVKYVADPLPASVPAGAATSVTLWAMDAVDNVATGYSGTASFTSSDPRATLPAAANFSEGQATGLSFALGTLGTQTITAADTFDPALTGTATTTVTAGAATALQFAQPAPSGIAGQALSPALIVRAVDAYGNPTGTGTGSVTLTLGNNPGGATLSGTVTASMVAGAATFSDLSLEKSGSGYTLNASSAGLASASSSAFNITAGTATQLAFAASPSSGKSGAALTPVVRVEVRDALGNRTLSGTSVTLALQGGTATLSGTTTVAAVNGIATFNDLSVDKVGTGYTLSAAAAAVASATSSSFDITEGDPARLAFVTQPSTITSMAPFGPVVTVEIQDAAGNRATQSALTVSLALGSNPGSGALQGTASVTAQNGIASFPALSLNTAGIGYTLLASAAGVTPQTSSAFNVMVGAPASVSFLTSPSGSYSAGSAIQAVVAVRDSGDNLVSSGASTITLTLNGGAPGAVLSGVTSLLPMAGLAGFSGLSVASAGTGYTLVAQMAGVPSAVSSSFDITPGPAVALGFTQQPSSISAGAAFTPQVNVATVDAYGNTVSSTATVSLSLTGASGGLSGTTSASATAGVATFANLSATLAGTGHTLTASAPGLASAQSSAFDVSTGGPGALAFKAVVSQLNAGEPAADVVLELQDAYGNLRPDSASTVELTLGTQPSGGAILGTTSTVPSAGRATFANLRIEKAGMYTLVARADGYSQVTSSSLTVVAGAPSRFEVSLAANALPGEDVAVTVTARDAYNNVSTGYSGTATVSLSDAAGTAPTTVSFVEGVAAPFMVKFSAPSSATVTVADGPVAGQGLTTVSMFAQPTVTLSGPKDGEIVRGRIALVAKTVVANGLTVAKLAIRVGELELASSTGESTLNFEWDTSGVAAGSYTLSAQATDSAGNVVSSQGLLLRIAPAETLVAPADAGGCGCSAGSGAETSAYFALAALAKAILSLRRRK